MFGRAMSHFAQLHGFMLKLSSWRDIHVALGLHAPM